MIGLLVEVFIKAFLLLILIYVVARDEADFEFRKVLMVTAAIILGVVILDAFLTRWIGLFTFIPIIGLIVFMVMQFCWVRFWRSLLIAVPFLMLNIMISTAVTSFQQKADAAMDKAMRGPNTDEDMKLAISMLQDGGTNCFPFPMGKEPPKMDDNLQQIILNFFEGLASKKDKSLFKSMSKSMPAGMKVKELINLAGNSESPLSMINAAGDTESPRGKARETISLRNMTRVTVSAADWKEAGKKINVTGTLIGEDDVRVAIANDQMIREDEYIHVEHENVIYRWRARFIRDGGISWEPMEAFGQ